MMRRFTELTRYAVKALHAEDIGHLRDLYLSADGWIRYLVVDANMAGFINRQVVLLSPTAIRAIPADATDIETDLDVDRVRAAPKALDDTAPTAEFTRRIDAHYGWDSRDSASGADRAGLVSLVSLLQRKLEAADGAVGPLKDVLIDLMTFRVSGLIVDAGSWLHARPIVLDAAGISLRSVGPLQVGLTMAQIKRAPSFDRFAPGVPDENSQRA